MTQPSPLASPHPWDLVAEAYDAELRPQFEVFAAAALQSVFSLEAEGGLGPAASRDVLDVATGPGTLAILAAKAGARVTAVDFAPEMLAHAKRRAEASGVELDLRVADATALPFADASFDAAFAMFVLMVVPDRARALAELRRVLRPGGRAALAAWVPLSRVPQLGAVFEELGKHVPSLPRSDGNAPLGTLDEVVREMRDAGFSRVAAREVSHVAEVPSIGAFWEVSQRTTAPFALLAKKLGPGWAPIAQRVQEGLEARFGSGPQQIAMIANIGVGAA